MALQDAEVCDSLDLLSTTQAEYEAHVEHGEGNFVFEAGLVFYVAEG